MQKHQFLNWIVTAFCALILSVGLLFSYWMYYPYKVIDWKNADGTTFNEKKDLIKVINKKVKAGDTLQIEYTACRYVDNAIEVNAQLLNGTIHTYSPIRSNLSKGCRSATSTTWEIPKDTPSGKYHFAWTFSYPVNPIRTFEATIISEEFIVENPLLDKLEEEVINGN